MSERNTLFLVQIGTKQETLMVSKNMEGKNTNWLCDSMLGNMDRLYVNSEKRPPIIELPRKKKMLTPCHEGPRILQGEPPWPSIHPACGQAHHNSSTHTHQIGIST